MKPLSTSIYVLIPTTMNVSIVTDTKQYADDLAKEFTIFFGGSNISTDDGYYLANDGSIVIEKIYRVWSFCSTNQLEEHIQDILTIAKHICSDLKQESLAIIINGKMYFIPPETK